MAAATAIELARIARRQAAADRAHRDDVLRSARAARRESRRLRDYACHQRDATLAKRWTYWAAGSIPHPPSYVPVSWEVEAEDVAAAAASAVRECRSTAAAILRLAASRTGMLPRTVGSRLPAVIALCEAAAVSLEDDEPEARTLLGACARACDALEQELETGWRDELGVALAATCRASARAIRRALVRLREREAFLDD